MKCEDCKGTGRYVGLRESGDCQSCQGTGRGLMKLDVIKPTQTEEDAVDAMNAMRGMAPRRSAIIPLQPIRSPNNPTTQLGVGDTVHVYDGEWIETVVMQITDRPTFTEVLAIYHHGNIKMRGHNICWNVTQQRYEYIRSGTPVYP